MKNKETKNKNREAQKKRSGWWSVQVVVLYEATVVVGLYSPRRRSVCMLLK